MDRDSLPRPNPVEHHPRPQIRKQRSPLSNQLKIWLGQALGLDTPLARAFVYGLKPPALSKRAINFAFISGILGIRHPGSGLL